MNWQVSGASLLSETGAALSSCASLRARIAAAAAAAAIRALSDAELDRAAPVSLNSDAPLTCQFMLEDHAVRHSYHHLAKIKAALQGTTLRLQRVG